MGYDLPAAIGACIASGGDEVVCLTGDGSLQMNLQELQTIIHHRLPIKLFVINNGGYHSIRQTQKTFFGEPLVGIGEGSAALAGALQAALTECLPADGTSAPDLDRLIAHLPVQHRYHTREMVDTLLADWATYLRGLDVIQVPTTLLAMVDSAIGGKTGVNLPLGKNLVGAFHQPRAVLIDPDVLATLPPRDIRGGLAEVIKYGVIADTALFVYLEENIAACLALEPAAITRVIADSARIKAQVVSADEHEGGLRAILNYGHTAGHAVEKAAGYRRLRHGEAVAIGMVAAERIGVRLGITPMDAARRIEDLIARTGLPTRIPDGLTVAELMQTLAFDKKAKGGTVKWVMAEKIGHAVPGYEVPDAVAMEVLRELGAEAQRR
jgi:hypothetical protein